MLSFLQGDLFQVPEVVPFRLTQNIVKAMGSTGIEGHFMKSCEITNRVIRNHSDQLLYVLKPFLYDFKLQKGLNTEEKVFISNYTFLNLFHLIWHLTSLHIINC